MNRIRFHWMFLVIAALVPVVGLFVPAARNLGELLRPIFIMAILALGLNILTGSTGLLNLGVAAFMALGAYAYAILTCDIYPFQLGFWPAVLLTVSTFCPLLPVPRKLKAPLPAYGVATAKLLNR